MTAIGPLKVTHGLWSKARMRLPISK